MTTPHHLTGDAVLTPDDLHLFNEGTHHRLYRKLGAHRVTEPGAAGVRFALWAPDAERVAVVGDFNGWRPDAHPLASLGTSGIWAGFVPGAQPGARYKFAITARDGRVLLKADPFAFRAEPEPGTASIVWDLAYDWRDQEWLAARAARNALAAPIAVYELHLGSWRRHTDARRSSLSYRELAAQLPDYVADLGFTHVELLPVMEHPFFGSWGYQVTGYFAASSRYGTPQDLMALIDALHRRGIGVILDWVPSHFPRDGHALARFDGTHLYEHADPRRGLHPDWDSSVFNYGRHEVRSFLLSSALFWLDVFHADGLRVDAVASMLYLDYSRGPGEWEPNPLGGREDLDAVRFLRELNDAVAAAHPDVLTIAEESTSWPGVTAPTSAGGLGFSLKWDMGWMHDTLRYLAHDPVHRSYHHRLLTFRGLYGFSERFLLPLSHDEVVHGKGSLLGRMPGDDWQRFANLRLLLAYEYLVPGKQLLFMGAELAQRAEWNHDAALDWAALSSPPHRGVQSLVRDLNRLYRAEPALHATDLDPAGFEWVDADDAERSTLAFLRFDRVSGRVLLVACNFTPVPRHDLRLGVPADGAWREVLNTDAASYGGSGLGNLGLAHAEPVPAHGRPHSLVLTLPPLAAIALAAEP
jgi:1,4-alpha-glucan branching enzyme